MLKVVLTTSLMQIWPEKVVNRYAVQIANSAGQDLLIKLIVYTDNMVSKNVSRLFLMSLWEFKTKSKFSDLYLNFQPIAAIYFNNKDILKRGDSKKVLLRCRRVERLPSCSYCIGN